MESTNLAKMPLWLSWSSWVRDRRRDDVRSLVFIVTLIGVIFTSALARPATKEPSGLTAVLIRAGNYVVRLEHDLATIVAEERYAQEVRHATSADHRELRSDV